ncbi:MAG: ABC transporter ATP-binding protein [Halioglobus sp.]|nr:ABC transporter ATP-binding protein [Halioglobus sp.]
MPGTDQTPDNALISLQGVSRDYRVGAETVRALRDVSVNIDPAEFIAIVGPSGSGKSTCMHILGCLQTPSRGSYRFGGADVHAMGPAELAQVRNARVGFVFQSFNLLPRLSALQNVELPLTYSPHPRDMRRDMATRALAATGMADRQHHLPGELSGGQMQRVAIARALVNNPDVVLADEPTGALDTQTGEEIMRLFATLNEAGSTVVLVTHEEQVAQHARRRLTFRDGMLIADSAAS